MSTPSDILRLYSESYEREKRVSLSLKEYLEAARDDSSLYSSAAERMVKAIGEPTNLDTSNDPRLGRIFMNRTIKTYKAFDQFYGLEETIERIVGFFRHESLRLIIKYRVGALFFRAFVIYTSSAGKYNDSDRTVLDPSWF